ncbi:MAG: glycosyltransferase family 9 protein [Ignavibacteriaceae bacterium]|nr:glycosyltransferase family 9 protein [Ignavibacteriaceae bacterium]
MKILIIALSGIGDALMFTPALKLLGKYLPGAEIDALVMYKGAKEIYSSNPNLNKVIYFNFLEEGAFKSLKFLIHLRKKYDASINVYPSNRKEYNLISFVIGAKKRAGVVYLRKNTSNFGFLNNIRVVENDNVHNVQTNIKLCEALIGKKFNEEPALEFPIPESEYVSAKKYLNELGTSDNELVIGFHPGCATLKNHIKRRWEPEKFADLGKKLIQDHNARILLFGGPEEDVLKEKISALINSDKVDIVKAESLTLSSAILKRCNVFVTNDSSQMHIAAAMGLKVVAIIGPTNQKYIYPWKTEHQIVSLNLDCSPCFFYSPRPLICNRTDVKFKCIKELTVDMVYSSVTKYLQTQSGFLS